jgi:hypothetical protein
MDPAAVMTRLTDMSRHAQVLKAFFITGISFTQGLVDIRVGLHPNPGAVGILLLIAYLFLAGISIDRQSRVGIIQTLAVLGLMLTGYFVVYLLTPLDLGYHIVTSLNRLFLQLWPSVIFLFFMMSGSPETVPALAQKNQSGKPKQESQRS